jgi:hypothetical protein
MAGWDLNKDTNDGSKVTLIACPNNCMIGVLCYVNSLLRANGYNDNRAAVQN